MDQNDTQYPSDAARGFDYNAAFAGASTQETERKVSGITVPSFSYYVVHFSGAKASFKQTGVPSVRAWGQIKEGPEGTVGVLVGDDVGNPFIAPSPFTTEDGVKVKKDAATLAKQSQAIQDALNKIARVGKFGLSRPTDLNNLVALETYAAQFEQGFDAVVEISEEQNEYQGNVTFRNRIKWLSLAALDDPAVTKQFAGQTAHAEAQAKIAERNKRNAAAKTGTAGASSRTSPESLFR